MEINIACMTKESDMHGSIEDIMNQYGGDIWNYAYFLTRDTEMADNISQDVFIKCYQNIQRFRGSSSLKTWLMTITRNTAFSCRKSKYFRIKSLTALFGFESDRANITEAGRSQSAEKEYLVREHVNEIWDVILNLPDKFREVLVLDLKFEMSIEEISKLTGIASGTVKSRLYRARKKVQCMLEEGQR